jgi:hypothetical protein
MRDAMITFSDLEGQLDVLRVDCDRCSRHGRYPVSKLIKDHGGDAKLGEWFSKLTKDCPQKNQSGVARACDAVMPDLRGVWEHLKDR